MSRLANQSILRLDLLPERRGRVIGGAQVLAQRSEPPEVAVERLFSIRDAAQQLFAAAANLLELRRPGTNTLRELAGSLLEPCHLGSERRRPLHEAGVRGTRFRGPLAQRVNGFPGLIQATLGVGQLRVRDALRLGQPLD